MDLIELNTEEKKTTIKELYNSFPTGREFEIFLNYFLEKLGFEDVSTTKYTGDNGIDLICSKRGLDLTGVDTLNYYVQAKRYAAGNPIHSAAIRDLKGTIKKDKNGTVLSCNFINVFITTSTFTKNAIKEAEDDTRNPTILIDGDKLLDLCIEYNIGFAYKPIFNKNMISQIIEKKQSSAENILANDYDVKGLISKNDIRARILRIPTLIKNSLHLENFDSLPVRINDKEFTLNIDKTKRYFGGVTQLYKDLGMITDKNEYIPKEPKWKIFNGKISITID